MLARNLVKNFIDTETHSEDIDAAWVTYMVAQHTQKAPKGTLQNAYRRLLHTRGIPWCKKRYAKVSKDIRRRRRLKNKNLDFGAVTRANILPHRFVLPEHKEAFEYMISLCTNRETFEYSQLRCIGTLLRHTAGDIAQFARLDGPTWRSVVLESNPHTVLRKGAGLVEFIKRHPMIDTDSTYSNHFWCIPTEFVHTYRSLVDYPSLLGRFLYRRLAEHNRHEEIGAVVEFVDRLCRGRLIHHGCQAMNRVRRSVTMTMVRLLAVLLRLPDPSVDMRVAFSRSQTITDLVELLARVSAWLNCNAKVRGCLSTTENPTKQADVLIAFVQGAINNGIFSPGTPQRTRIPMASVRERMIQLESNDSVTYTAFRDDQICRYKPPITQGVVQRLYHGANTTTELCVILLLATTGIRSEALEHLTVEAVWDKAKQNIRRPMRIIEKNQQIRQIVACPELVAVMSKHILKTHPGDPFVYLFPNPRDPRRPRRRVGAQVLLKVCRRLAIQPPVHCHQFRAYIVHQCQLYGVPFERASKWLGHRHAGTTFRHYYTDTNHNAQIAKILLENTEEDTIDSTLYNEPVDHHHTNTTEHPLY